MESPRCPVCGNEVHTVVHVYVSKSKDLIKCLLCDLYFVWPRQVVSLDRVYDEGYYKAWALDELKELRLLAMKRVSFNRILDDLNLRDDNMSILDIGCGMGHLLITAQERGLDAYGVEISSYAARIAGIKIGHERIWTGDFMKLSLPGRTFDIITAVDLIEHIYEPGKFFIRCRALLADRGYLVLVTPDINSLSHRILGNLWPHFNEQHVIFFSRKSMRAVLQDNGFRILAIKNYRKSLNLLYMRAVLRIHGSKLLLRFVELICLILPKWLKQKNFSLLHGEMIVIARKA